MTSTKVEQELSSNDCCQKLTVVAFHTKDVLYEQEAKRMKASADRLQIPVFIEIFESKGDWVKNAAIKASFLQKMREAIRGPILYVDVDAVFHEDPRDYLLMLSDCDLAVHFDCKDDHLMSGTMLINDTPEASALMQEWVTYCHENPEAWDQKALEIILEQHPEYRCHKLPVVFCWVFDREYNFTRNEGLPIYIEHLQASRSAKKPNSLWKRLFKKNKSLDRREKRLREIEALLNRSDCT